MLPDIHEQTQGRWRGILMHFGLGQRELSGKHCPCPMCGGRDRFRFTDYRGEGRWICNQCGSGSGLDLVMALRGWDFGTAAPAIREVVGFAQAEPVKEGLTDERKRELRRELWAASVPITRGDPVDRYLEARGVDLPSYPPSLRYCAECRYKEGTHYPAMIAAVQDIDGNGATLHRTFLQGASKAPVDSPRMMMPGEVAKGSAVRLAPAAETMGIAEGIETALAASDRFHMPVWAALTANGMADWQPPRGVREVIIFADNDESMTGQAVSYQLGRRLKREGFQADVCLPDRKGTDWADYTTKSMEAV